MRKKLIIAAMAVVLAAPAVAESHGICSSPHSFWLFWLPPSC